MRPDAGACCQTRNPPGDWENRLGIVVYARASLSYCFVMNILIENDSTLEYLVSSGSWSKNPKTGKRFRVSDEAFKAAKQEAIGKFTIVFHIPETNQFVNLDHGRGKGAPEPASEEVSPLES